MDAKYGNIVATKRNRLEDVIPLSTPFSICIDPSNVCNFKCQFCAVQYSDEPVSFKKQIMDYDFFCKIIDDISAFGQKLKVLRLNGQGEPLVNPRFPDMIAYAKKKMSQSESKPLPTAVF